MALGNQHDDLRGLSRPWASAESMVVIGAMDIILEPSCCRATDADMTLGSISGLDISMTPDGNTDTPRSLTCSQVADQTPGISTAFSSNRGHGHQLRSCLLLGHEPRHSPL